MKKSQKLCAVTTLVLALACPVLAGEVPTPGAKSTCPPQESSVPGDIGTPGVTSTGETSDLDPVTEIMLSLLQNVVSIF